MTWFLGKYLKRYMDKKGWNNSRLAQEAGLSPPYIGFILKGKDPRNNKPPAVSLDTVIALSDALGIDELSIMIAYQGMDPDKEGVKRPKSESAKKDERYDKLLKAVSQHFTELYPDENERTQKLIELMTKIS